MPDTAAASRRSHNRGHWEYQVEALFQMGGDDGFTGEENPRLWFDKVCLQQLVGPA